MLKISSLKLCGSRFRLFLKSCRREDLLAYDRHAASVFIKYCNRLSVSIAVIGPAFLPHCFRIFRLKRERASLRHHPACGVRFPNSLTSSEERTLPVNKECELGSKQLWNPQEILLLPARDSCSLKLEKEVISRAR